jgi:hypothetical protein
LFPDRAADDDAALSVEAVSVSLARYGSFQKNALWATYWPLPLATGMTLTPEYA